MLVKGWEKQLEHEMLEAACRTTDWPQPMDVLWVATCVARMTGIDPLQLGDGESRAKAAKALKKNRIESLALQQGWKEVKPNFAQRGDVVLVGGKGGVVGLCGRRVWLARHPDGSHSGVLVVDVKKATRAWRIE